MLIAPHVLTARLRQRNHYTRMMGELMWFGTFYILNCVAMVFLIQHQRSAGENISARNSLGTVGSRHVPLPMSFPFGHRELDEFVPYGLPRGQFFFPPPAPGVYHDSRVSLPTAAFSSTS